MVQPVDLTTRRFERREVILDAEFVIDPKQRDQICFSSSNPNALNPYTIKVTMADIAEGGVGTQTSTFLPRMAYGVIRVIDPRTNNCDKESHDNAVILFEHKVCVRRVELTSRIPTFFVGMSFEQVTPDLLDQMEQFMDKISESMRLSMQERLQDMEKN